MYLGWLSPPAREQFLLEAAQGSLPTQEGSRCLTKDLGLRDRSLILEININPKGERLARVSAAMHI